MTDAKSTTFHTVKPIAVKAARVPRTDGELRARHDLYALLLGSWWKLSLFVLALSVAFSASVWVAFIQPERELTYRLQLLQLEDEFRAGVLMCAARADARYGLDEQDSWQWRKACFDLMIQSIERPSGPRDLVLNQE